MYLLELPLEIIYNIFRLAPPDVFNVFPLLCVHFKDIHKDERFWHYLCEENFHFSPTARPIDKPFSKFYFDLGRFYFKWNEIAGAQISNKGFTVSRIPSFPDSVIARGSEVLTVENKYFEVRIDECKNLATSSPFENIFPVLQIGLLSSDNNFYSYTDTGHYNQNDIFVRWVHSPMQVGDRIGVLLVQNYMTISFYYNGKFLGTPYANLPRRPMYPAVKLGDSDTEISVILPIPSIPPMPLSF